MEEIDTKEVRHERELRVKSEYIRHSLGGSDGVRCALCEAGCCDPVVVVVEHTDGVPFAMDEDVEDVQDESAVGDGETHIGDAVAARL